MCVWGGGGCVRACVVCARAREKAETYRHKNTHKKKEMEIDRDRQTYRVTNTKT